MDIASPKVTHVRRYPIDYLGRRTAVAESVPERLADPPAWYYDTSYWSDFTDTLSLWVCLCVRRCLMQVRTVTLAWHVGAR